MLRPPKAVLEELHATANVGGHDARLAQIAKGISGTRHTTEIQGYPENPDGYDPMARTTVEDSFVVAVACSGGLDSVTAMSMAHLAGLDPIPVYVDTGAAYSQAEWVTLNRIAQACGWEPPTRLRRPTEYTKAGYVDPGRNYIIIRAIADAMFPPRSGNWGGIWFGNVSDWAETPITGGDKTHRFFTDTQHMLTALGHDVQVVSPLIGMTKGDCMRWLRDRGLSPLIGMSRSCYEPEGPCGRCRSCFRKAIACADARVTLEWPGGYDFTQHIAQYRKDRRQAIDAYENEGFRTVAWAGTRTEPIEGILKQFAPVRAPAESQLMRGV